MSQVVKVSMPLVVTVRATCYAGPDGEITKYCYAVLNQQGRDISGGGEHTSFKSEALAYAAGRKVAKEYAADAMRRAFNTYGAA